MKCPKCHYVSFDPEPRCRNCGYTLELDADLVIERPPAKDAPPVDLELRTDVPPKAPAPTPTRPIERVRTPERIITPIPVSRRADERPPRTPTPAPRQRREPPPPTTELPLFVKPVASDPPESEPAPPERPEIRTPAPGKPVSPPQPATPVARRPGPVAQPGPSEPDFATEGAGDEPLLELPLTPAPPPLGVRRATTDLLRSPAPRQMPTDAPELLHGLDRPVPQAERPSVRQAPAAPAVDGTGAGKRLGAAVVDAVVLGATSALVAGVTLRWMDLTWQDWTHLPLLPLVAFLLIIVTGYLFIFTLANGQTPGKMLTGIRVVAVDASEGPLAMSQALLRALAALPAVLLAGLGFLPALFGEQRAVHDRIARTRVIRA
jgi:uncharacterized RDD family membrane protein YckC